VCMLRSMKTDAQVKLVSFRSQPICKSVIRRPGRNLVSMTFRSALPISVVLLAACTSDGSTVIPTRADSSGVSVLQYPADLEALSDRSWSTEPDPVVVIGEPTPELYQVGTALFQSEGGIVVADGSSQEILLFDESGDLLQRVAGKGNGPGEFTQLLALTVGVEDSLYAYDHRQRRISVFNNAGEFARSVTLQGLEGLGRQIDLGVLRGGEIVGAFQPWVDGTGLVRDSVIFVVFSAAGELVDTLGVFPHTYTDWGPHTDPVHGGSGSFPAPVPLSSMAAIGFGGSAVFVGLPDAYTLIRLEPIGTRRETRWHHLPQPATEAHRDRLFETLAAMFGEGQELDVLRGVDIPASLPAFGCEQLTQLVGEKGLLVTDTDGVWLRPFHLPDHSGASSWPMFDASGQFEGIATMPPGFRPTAVLRDLVLGVHRDSLDVESVRVYRMAVDR
jgi:hypothetical protein